jgi:hypothetical protein
MIQRLSVIIVLYLSFCWSEPDVVSMGSRRRYLANNNNNSTKQNSTSDKITANNSDNIVPNKDTSKVISVPTSQPSSIFKAPSQDIVTEGPTADSHHENHYNDKNIGGSQNINKEIVEEDAYALSAAKYSFYAILSFLLFYGLIQIIKRYVRHFYVNTFKVKRDISNTLSL